MAEPQYKRIHDKMKASGELLMHLDWFVEKLRSGKVIDEGATDWVRLDRLVHSEEEIFRHVAFSSDYEFARDQAGNIYVTKDHALNIHGWEHDRIKKKLEVARNWILVLSGLIALYLLAHCTS